MLGPCVTLIAVQALKSHCFHEFFNVLAFVVSFSWFLIFLKSQLAFLFVRFEICSIFLARLNMVIDDTFG